MGITFLKRPKSKQFNLKTRYYDPEKEAQKKRMRIYDRVSGDYDYDPKEMRNEIEYRWGLNRESNSSFNKRYTSLNRILMTALILAVIIAILVYVKIS
ncbi:MAG: hypothetical protein DRI84_10515 [Bacteroidetes bacterium]|nr:MAG: hypothetical protein DRI84_10515 [Bacteroidota bacterium]